jgi:hypothetical protein
MEFSINYMTVGIATVANFIIGALWYGPLFGKTWMRLSGITMESMKGMSMTPVKAMTLGFIGTLLLSLVLAHVAAAFEAAGAAGALELAFWIWLGFFLPVVAGGYLWEGLFKALLVLFELLILLFIRMAQPMFFIKQKQIHSLLTLL